MLLMIRIYGKYNCNFSSDHGDGIGAHNWNQKSALYEEVVNIPLIVSLPGKNMQEQFFHRLLIME